MRFLHTKNRKNLIILSEIFPIMDKLTREYLQLIIFGGLLSAFIGGFIGYSVSNLFWMTLLISILLFALGSLIVFLFVLIIEVWRRRLKYVNVKSTPMRTFF